MEILGLIVPILSRLEVDPGSFISKSGEGKVDPLHPQFWGPPPLAFFIKPGESHPFSTGNPFLALEPTASNPC